MKTILKDLLYVGRVFLICLIIVLIFTWFCDYMVFRDSITSLTMELENTKTQISCHEEILSRAEIMDVATDHNGYIREVK